MYFSKTSIETPPVEDTKYPLLQSVREWLPQYGKLCFSCKKELDFAFKQPIIDARQSLGLVDNIKWMWSSSPLISGMPTPIELANAGRCSYRSESTD